MISDRGIVIENIYARDLGRKTRSHTVSSQNAYLKFQIGSEILKTTTKSHVGADVAWAESVRFAAKDGDTLTITALHRRSLVKRLKVVIGQAHVALSELGSINVVTLLDENRRNIGNIHFSINGIVSLKEASEIASERAASEPLETREASASTQADDAGSAGPAVIAEACTTHNKQTTTTSVTETADVLHKHVSEQDAEAHMLIEAGKARLLDDESSAQLLSRNGRQSDSVVLTAGVLCKLLLASYLALLDVIITRVLELIGWVHLGPRKLQLKTTSVRPVQLPSILKRPENALDAPDTPLATAASSSAGTGAPAESSSLPDVINDHHAPATPDTPVATSPVDSGLGEGCKAGSVVEDSAMKRSFALTSEE